MDHVDPYVLWDLPTYGEAVSRSIPEKYYRKLPREHIQGGRTVARNADDRQPAPIQIPSDDHQLESLLPL